MNIDRMEFMAWMDALNGQFGYVGDNIDDLQKETQQHWREELFDNQDLLQMLKISNRSLQRYRSIGKLPYYTISGKLYYKLSDVHQFIRKVLMPLPNWTPMNDKHCLWLPYETWTNHFYIRHLNFKIFQIMSEAKQKTNSKLPEQLSDILLVLDKAKNKIRRLPA